MLDLPRMERIRLSPRPRFQRFVALTLLAPNYNIPPRVRIRFEETHHLPPGPVIFAMNHTDRYNYWPFQYRLWRAHGRFTATWVKGKYYEHPLMGWFMEKVNSIPTVSRGYIMVRDFVATVGRRPEDAEYAAMRALVLSAAGLRPPPPPDEAARLRAALPAPLFERPRDMLGRPFDPEEEGWAEAVAALYERMMARFVALNEEAWALGLDILVFPQGTRSIRLSRGHIGLAQIALHLGATVVPVGCSGSDKVYPGGSPIARAGEIVYRFGAPIGPDAMAPFRPPEPFAPFSAAAEIAHRERFQALVDMVMARINDLVAEPYRFAETLESDGVSGARRFV